MARTDDPRDPDARDLFWELDEPLEPFEPAGGGRVYGNSLAAEEESGDAWQQFFPEPTTEGYGGPDGRGDFEPYGDERWAAGRETRLSPDGPTDARYYGELYGRDREGWGHRRRSYYAEAGNSGERMSHVGPEQGPYSGRGPRNYRRGDERLRDELVRRLTVESWLDASEVEVDVQEGEVTLRGNVGSRQERRLAEDIAAAVRGVRDVHNHLQYPRERDERPRRRDEHDH